MKLQEKIIRVGNSKCVLIPSKIIKSLKLELGDEVLLDIINDKIVIEKRSVKIKNKEVCNGI